MIAQEDTVIRTADIADLPRVAALAQEFSRQSAFTRNFDPDRFIGVWVGLLEAATGEIFLLTDGDAITGALGGVIYPDLYSGSPIATEFFWYVQPGARGQGMKLYQEFERWARRWDCVQIRMVHLMDSMPEKLSRVYARMGFSPSELHYVKEL
jgi:GNAT superfamily N-acetyltransferase